MYIYGRGGFGREIFRYLERNNKDKVLAFITDIPEKKVDTGIRTIMHDSLELFRKKVLICFGDPKMRKKAYDILIKENKSIIFDKVQFSEALGSFYAKEGSIICPNCNITEDVLVGKFSNIHVGATVSHDVIISDFVTISPMANISGFVNIKRGAFIGASATIKEGIVIGENSIVGMGACVIKDVPNGATVVGNPSRIIKEKQ